MPRSLAPAVDTAQQIAELLTSLLSVFAVVLDRDLTPVAGTGPVREYRAHRRHADLCVNCMRTGLPAWDAPHEPGGEPGNGLPVVACPVLVDGAAAGAIALIPRDAEQGAALRSEDRHVTDLLLVMAGLLAGTAVPQGPSPSPAGASSESMQAALDSLRDGIIAVDHAGIVLYCNRAAHDKLLAEMDLTGQPLVHWYPPAAPPHLERREGIREVTFDRRGRRLSLLEEVSPLRHGGRVIGRLVVLRDIPAAGAVIRPPRPTLADAERQLIQEAMARCGTSGEGKRQAARELGVSLATLYRKLRQYGIGQSAP